LDLVLANGAIPVTDLKTDAGPVQVLENVHGEFANVTSLVGLDRVARENGRGLAVADADNDGRLDIAVNTVGGRLLLLRRTARRGHWLRVELPRFAPGAVVTAVLPAGPPL